MVPVINLDVLSKVRLRDDDDGSLLLSFVQLDLDVDGRVEEEAEDLQRK